MDRFEDGFQSDSKSSSDDEFWSTSSPLTKSVIDKPKEKETPSSPSPQQSLTDKKQGNIDELEDSLFSSFASNQRKKRQQRVTERQQKVQATTTTIAATAKPSTTDSTAPAGSKPIAQKQPPAKPKPKKPSFDIDDDLLAELLSDSDDEEKKVKQTAEQAAAIEPATGDSVTSLDTVSAEASSNAEDKEEMKMPTFSAEPVLPPVKGKKSDFTLPVGTKSDLPPLTFNTKSELSAVKSALPPLKKLGRRTASASSPTEIKPELPSFLDMGLDSPTAQKPKLPSTDTTAKETKKKSTKSRRSAAKPAARSSDEDDDILSCLGLDESPVTKKKQPTKKRETKKAAEIAAKPTSLASVPNSTEPAAASRKDKDPEMSLFGSYLPTASSDSSTKSRILPNRSPLILSSPSSSSLSSPSTSPNSPKKNVRFSETLEISDGVVRTKASMNGLDGKSASKLLTEQSEPSPSADASLTSSPLADGPVLTSPNESQLKPARQPLDSSTSLFGEIESSVKQPRKRPTFLKSSGAISLFEDPPTEPATLDRAASSQAQPEVTAASSPVVDDPVQLLLDNSPSLSRKKSCNSPPKSPTEPTSPATPSISIQPPTSDQPEPVHDKPANFVSPHESRWSSLTSSTQQPSTVPPRRRSVEKETTASLVDNNHREQGDGAGVSQPQPVALQQLPAVAQEPAHSLSQLSHQMKSQVSELEEKIRELESSLTSVKSKHSLLETQSRVAEEKARQEKQRMEEEKEQQASSHRLATQELNSQLDELKLKLHKSELDREKLSLSMEATKQSHSAELLAAQSSNSAKLQSLEEDNKRKESRLISEKEAEVSLCKQQLQQLEQEKLTAVTALKRQVAALEETRVEITKIKETHRTSLEELRRQHELDIEQVKQRHREELEDLRSVYSHTRKLTELTHQVESSVKEVSCLQGRFSNTLADSQREKEEAIKAKDNQLKTMEKRLTEQQIENEKERERLHSLLAKFERHISEKANELEKDRWKLQQDKGRLEAREKAFEDDRDTSLKRIEEQKERLQREKEKLLADHQEGLVKTFSETRSVAAERAELTALEKTLREREQELTKRAMKIETDLIAAEARLSTEKERVVSELEQLARGQQKLSLERDEVEEKLKKIEATKNEIENRTQALNRIAKAAEDVHTKGLEAVLEAEKKQHDIKKQWKLIKKEAALLREKEKAIAMDRLVFLKEKREHVQQVSAASHLNMVDSQFQPTEGSHVYSLNSDPFSHHHTIPHHSPTYTSHHPPTTSTPYHHSTRQSSSSKRHGHDLSLCNACRAHNHKSTMPSLAEQQVSQFLRQMEQNAEMDHKILREEAKYLGYLEATSSHLYRRSSVH